MIEMILWVLLATQTLLIGLLLGYKIRILLVYWQDFPTVKSAWEAYKREGKEWKK